MSVAHIADETNALLDEALARWKALAGLAEPDEDGTVTISFGKWDDHSATKEMEKARELDPTGVTTLMLLKGYYERFLREVKFDAAALLDDKVGEQLATLRALRDVLAHDLTSEIVENFVELTRNGVQLYDPNPDEERAAEYERTFEDGYLLATLRYSAIRAMQVFKAHQFVQGTHSEGSPKLNYKIWEFWNINSLVRAMVAQKIPGLSLCLIRDPEDPLQSYFVFACSNGQTVTILTDKRDEEHPDQRYMTRKPGRMLSEQADQGFFPYQLLELTLDKFGRFDGVRARKGLVPINVEAVALSDFTRIEPYQVIWLGYMFDLIRHEYFVERRLLPELSYTGEQVREPLGLVSGDKALVAAGTYKPLELPRIKRDDLDTDKLEEKGQWRVTPTRHNQWMIERYGEQVPEEAFDVVGKEADDLTLLLGDVHKQHGRLSDSEARDLHDGHEFTAEVTHPIQALVVRTATKRELDRPFFDREKPVEDIKGLRPTDFGTADHLRLNQEWAARSNQTILVQRLAEKDFEETYLEVYEWVRQRLEANQDILLDHMARMEFQLPKHPRKTFGHDTDTVEAGNALRMAEGREWRTAFGGSYIGTPSPRFYISGEGVGCNTLWEQWWKHQKGERPVKPNAVYCADRTDIKATVFGAVTARIPEAVALLCGCTVEELPWQLQVYSLDEPYSGNSILSRVDPAEWKLHNPWGNRFARTPQFTISVGFALCKNAFHTRRKALGLPRVKLQEVLKSEED